MGLLKPTTSPRIWFEIHGLDPFEVLVQYQTPEEMRAINQACQRNVLDKATRQIVKETDNEAVSKLMIRSMVKDWRGLTPAALKKLMPLDAETEAAIVEAGGTLVFSDDDLQFLADHTYANSFMGAIMDLATDMQAFRKIEEAMLVKNSVG
jgi:hypothetical protein